MGRASGQSGARSDTRRLYHNDDVVQTDSHSRVLVGPHLDVTRLSIRRQLDPTGIQGAQPLHRLLLKRANGLRYRPIQYT